MSYCLNSTELESLLLLYLEDKAIDNVTLKSLFDNAIQWQDKLLCLTFSFARILERQRDSTKSDSIMTSTFFSMTEELFLEIEECGEKFVDYMLKHELFNEIDLEKKLLIIAKDLSEYRYDKETLCD